MSIHHNTLKYVSLEIGGNEFRAQISTWRLVDNTDEPEKIYSFGADGENEDSEDPEDARGLELKFFSDWRTPTGLNHYMWTNAGQTVNYTIIHNLGSAGESPEFAGQVKLKRTPVGGDVRTTEVTELTLPVVGVPDYTPAA